jgi:hypothetical protein
VSRGMRNYPSAFLTLSRLMLDTSAYDARSIAKFESELEVIGSVLALRCG